MNILDDNKDDLIKYFKIAILENNIELEYIYKNKLNVEKFLELISHCNDKYKKMDVVTTLDIKVSDKYNKKSYKDIRTTIVGIHNIKEYCKTEKLNDSMNMEFMEKTNYYNDGERYTIDDEEYNYRINLKNEVDLDKDHPEVINLRDNWDKEKKFFRYKKRTSFLTYDNLFRIDLTVTKSNKFNKAMNSRELFKTFKEAKILKNKEIYELEVEYVGNMLLNSEVNIINFLNRNIQTDELQELGIPVNNIYESPKIIETTSLNKIKLTSLNNLEDQTEIYDKIQKLILVEDNLNIIIDQFNMVLYDLNSYITKSLLIMKNEEKDNLIIEYLKLTGQKLKGKKQFMAPNPITIDFNQLNIEYNGNIIQNYLVTEKADGDRYLLFINNKIGYLINNQWDVINTGIIFEKIEGNWLLDGEYITLDKNKKPINLFMIFDIYYSNNKSVHKYPYISKKNSRENEMEIFKKELKNINYTEGLSIDKILRIDIKKYEKGATKIEPVGSVNFNSNNKKILEKSKRILDRSVNDGFEYKIDGLIYLPSNLPVKATYEWQPGLDAPTMIGGKWPLNYKWKPETENTIDFQVKIKTENIKNKERDIVYPYKEIDENGEEILGNYKIVKLIVYYNESEDNNSDICMKMLTDKFSINKNDRIKFTPPDEKIDYGITNIPLVNDKIICIRDESELRNNDIVEMRYNKDWKTDGNGFKWTPLRLRRDKISPQHFLAANNIWKTIKTPIKESMIRGDIDLENIKQEINITGNTDDYYQESEKQTPYTKPLRDFHNFIKAKLIGGVGSSNELPDNKKILDTSIGRGGDTGKFSNPEINCRFLLGMDIAPVEVACNRYYFDKRQDKMKAVFMRYDTSKNIKEMDGIENWGEGHHGLEYSKNMLNILYNKNISSIDKKFTKINKIYNGLASDGFNIISSQFSFHYYFKDEKTLDGYLKNIRDNCKKGGYFIGTCYDGMKIFERLKSDKPFEYKDELGNIIYKIEKKYDIDEFTYNDEDDSSNLLGKEINVYMESIGQDINEYLVNFDYFIKKMKDYGFEPHKPRMKFKYNRVIDSSIESFETILNKLPKLNSEEDGDNLLKGKAYKNSINILENPELMELTKMNNYFIFKKK